MPLLKPISFPRYSASLPKGRTRSLGSTTHLSRTFQELEAPLFSHLQHPNLLIPRGYFSAFRLQKAPKSSAFGFSVALNAAYTRERNISFRYLAISYTTVPHGTRWCPEAAEVPARGSRHSIHTVSSASIAVGGSEYKCREEPI